MNHSFACRCATCGGASRSVFETEAMPMEMGSLRYRVGTHSSFVRTMLARLASNDFPALRALRTRETSDFAVALLDSWATIADVLSFYQERIANEGYLPTAVERRSVLELARLVGYRVRPGVAASVYLAFAIDKLYDGLLVERGTRAQSLPVDNAPSESYETIADVRCYSALNRLGARLRRPQFVTEEQLGSREYLYLGAAAVNVAPNDPLLVWFGAAAGQTAVPALVKVVRTEPDFTEQRVKVWLKPSAAFGSTNARDETGPGLLDLLRRLVVTQKLTPVARNPQEVPIRVAAGVNATSDVLTKTFGVLHPDNWDAAYATLAGSHVTQASAVTAVEVLRVKAGVFGNIAPQRFVSDGEGLSHTEEWPLVGLEKLTYLHRPETKEGAIEWQTAEEPAVKEDPIKFDTANARSYERAGSSTTVSIVPGQEHGDVQLTYQPAGSSEALIVRLTTEATNESPAVFRIVIPGSTPRDGLEVTEKRTIQLRLGDTRIETSVLVTGKSRALQLVLSRGESPNVLALDAPYERIATGSHVAIVHPNQTLPRVFTVQSARVVSRSQYGISAKVSELFLDAPWREPTDRLLSDIRDVEVLVQSEALDLSDEPILEDVAGDVIELDSIVSGFEAGRVIIVRGERADLNGTSGVIATERAMILGVNQAVFKVSDPKAPEGTPNEFALPGDRLHTFLTLTRKLQNSYRRSSVILYANVAEATHGETKTDVLGNGDATLNFAHFSLRQPPLTFVSAPTARGSETTLEVYVDQVRWTEVDSLGGLGPEDSAYVVDIDDDGKTWITFGDGQHGRRPTSGVENITAQYRRGIGQGGNVLADQITLLTKRPIGVKEVTNPLPGTGGADRESRDQARRNVPLGRRPLGRLVSVRDYADYARTFAGVGKATAVLLSNGRQRVLHVTIAGEDDAPLGADVGLRPNLEEALRIYGDPDLPVQVDERDLLLLVLEARLKVAPNHQFVPVANAVRAQLGSVFGFDARQLGQPVFTSELITIIQRVPGVDYVDLERLDAIGDTQLSNAALLEAIAEHPARDVPAWLARPNPAPTGPRILPAQLAIFHPRLTELLQLQEIGS